MAVSATKKAYMRKYNRRPEVKAKKALYMRDLRAAKDNLAAVELVNFLLESGYEDMAYQYALERAPQMLVRIKNRNSGRIGKV